ncbi:SEC-C metal-binding domain-containing protein [Dehalococcoidia bacterium]|nr:SEC-C metal-binding domain-containing protein [Dehalococcoidia bacterium]
MVAGKERTNWYEGHPSACTCADCTTRAAEQRRFDDVTQGRKLGRNEKCPCGSGKKYKKCHGQ